MYEAPTSAAISRAPKELQSFAKKYLEPRHKEKFECRYTSGKLRFIGTRAAGCGNVRRIVIRMLMDTCSQGPFVEGGFKSEETFWWKAL